jgi:2-methylcitrate dehydratase PrpD
MWDLRLDEHAAVEKRARWLLLDTLTCAISARNDPTLVSLEDQLASTMPGPIAWPGFRKQLSVPAAAMLGTMAACWYEACEGLAQAHGRPGLHAVPVALSLALARNRSLTDTLAGIVAGYELGGRAGVSMRIRPGLHVDGTWGLIAACAASARMLELSVEETHIALATAACQLPSALYRPVTTGHTARNTYAPHASVLGLFLCQTAAAGVTAPLDIFPHAAAHLAADDRSLESWAWPESEAFLILEGYLKPYAAVRHTHYGAAAAEQWRQLTGESSAEITAIDLEIYEEALTYCGNRAPVEPIQAQFSLSFAVATVLHGRDLSPLAYTREAMSDPECCRLEALVRMRATREFPGRGARLTVTTRRGARSIRVNAVLGDPEKPFKDSDLRHKARTYLSPVLGSSETTRLIDAVLCAPGDTPLASILNP